MISTNVLLILIGVLTIIGLVIFVKPSVAKHKKSGKGIKIVIGILLFAAVIYIYIQDAQNKKIDSEIQMAEESVDTNFETTDSIVPKGDSLINEIVIDTMRTAERRIPNPRVDSAVRLNNRKVYISRTALEDPNRTYKDSIMHQVTTLEEQKNRLLIDQKRYSDIIRDLQIKQKEAEQSILQTKTRDYNKDLGLAQNKLDAIRKRIAGLDNDIQRLSTLYEKLAQ